MRVPNQTRRSLNTVFSSSQEKSNLIASLKLQENEKNTVSQGFIQLVIWMLALPAITLILYLLS